MSLDPRSGNDWRDANDAPAQQQELIQLLARAARRLAVAAQGLDPALDEALAELRRVLRRELNESGQLAALIDAIDNRIKHIDDERDQRGVLLQRDLHRMAEQLLAVAPTREIAAELKSFQKNIKKRLSGGTDLALLTDFSALQEQVFATDSAQVPRAGLLARWFGQAVEPLAEAAAREAISESADPIAETPPREIVSEPPFSRISAAVCQVLDDLLRRIEPPPQASEHHRHASAQIEKGLNWYELVSTLEAVSLIVQAALSRGQGEIQQFLVGLNRKLADADQALQASRQHQVERIQADSALNETVRGEVDLMRTQVAGATELSQLKAQVSLRLESVVDAMDAHKHAEEARQRALESQLDTLTARIRDMEAQAALVEERMLEQRRMALLDTLTQLPNRLAYDERLQYEFQRWQRYQRPLTLAICDIDHFKTINDTYGHLAGDKVLRIVAKALRGRLRQTDFIARFGGEEFVILMPETSLEEAFRAIDEIRLAVANCPFHFREQPVTITLSAGLAVFNAGAHPDAVFERADAALYRAKQGGRNRCMLDAD